MASNFTTHLVHVGLDEPEQTLSLKGSLTSGSGQTNTPHLCLFETGVRLVGPGEGSAGVNLDLSNGVFGWEASLGRDSLVVAGQRLTVPLGSSSKAKEMIATGRLRAGSGAARSLPIPNRFVRPSSALYELWLARNLNDHEAVLAWLGTSTDLDVTGPGGRSIEGEARFLLTDQRVLLVALNELGDVKKVELSVAPLVIEERVGRDRISSGALTFSSEITNDIHFRELSKVVGMGPLDRLTEVARLLALDGGAAEVSAASRLLRLRLTNGAAPLMVLGLALIEARGGGRTFSTQLERGDPRDAVQQLATSIDVDGAGIARWAEVWSLDGEEREALLSALTQTEESSVQAVKAALPLHIYHHRLSMETTKDSVSKAVFDIALAEHLVIAGQLAEAEHLLQERLTQLPDESLSDLLPPAEADLTVGHGGQALRIRLLELLVEARGEPGIDDAEALAELVRLQPLVVNRLHALVDVAPSGLADRASSILGLLDGRDLTQPTTQEVSVKPVALPTSAVDGGIQHPAARAGGAVASLQRWLGKAKVPDRSTLMAYSERLSSVSWPAASEAIADAKVVLGLPSELDAFISRGELSVGIRAYGGEPPFLLIGFDHLSDGTDFNLDPAELRFLVGAELAHLRFNHTRITASEVWDGVLNSGSAAVDVMAALLGPLGIVGKALSGFSSLAQLQAAGRLIQRHMPVVQAGAEGAATVVGASHKLRRWSGTSKPVEVKDVAHRREELLAFCRTLQLTADRAGLIVCGDISAATRGILKSTRRLRPVLDIAGRHGLAASVARRGEGGELLEQDLAIRLAALFSFYLSDDYVALRVKATTA